MSYVPRIPVIGITGKMYSGKDTAGLFFTTLIRNSTKDAFANPLKEILMNYFGFTRDQLYDPKKKSETNKLWNMTNREAMQRFGTECIRNNFDKDAWVKIMQMRIEKSIYERKTVVLTDVRFDNEAKMIRDLGGKVIEVVRELPNNDIGCDCDDLITLDVYQMFHLEFIEKWKKKKSVKNTHASEKGIDAMYVNHTLYNSGTYTELYKRMFALFHASVPLDVTRDNPKVVEVINKCKNDKASEAERGLYNMLISLKNNDIV